MQDNDWKKRLNIVFSTNPDFQYDNEEVEPTIKTLPNNKQQLLVALDKRHRNGKSVTLISGFVGTEEDLNTLAKTLKTRCGVGGSVKENEILLQGDWRDKVVEYLISQGYKAKRGN